MGNRVDSKEHLINIQKDLDKMVDWGDRWQMKFNVAKCKVMFMLELQIQIQVILLGVTNLKLLIQKGI